MTFLEMQSKDICGGHVGVIAVDCPMCFSPSFYLESFVQSFLVTHTTFGLRVAKQSWTLSCRYRFSKERKKEKRCIEC